MVGSHSISGENNAILHFEKWGSTSTKMKIISSFHQLSVTTETNVPLKLSVVSLASHTDDERWESLFAETERYKGHNGDSSEVILILIVGAKTMSLFEQGGRH